MTERGDLVRSKSELVIADKLHARGIDYAYEQRLVLPDGRTRYLISRSRMTRWGLPSTGSTSACSTTPGYRARWER